MNKTSAIRHGCRGHTCGDNADPDLMIFDDVVVLPFVKASGRYKFSQRVYLQGGGNFLSWPDDRLVDVFVGVGYRFSDDWEWLAGYYYYARDIKTDELRNVVDYNIPILSVRHKL